MKLTINREHLATALALVKRAAAKTKSVPILQHCLLEAEGDKLKLTCSSLDFTISCQVLADIGKSGAIALPAKHLLCVVKDMAGSTVSIESEGNTSLLVSGDAEFRIPGLPEDTFPSCGFQSQEFSMWRTDLRRLITLSHFAQSEDENRYILNGTLLSRIRETVTMTATDGRTLAQSSGSTSDKAEGAGEFIIWADAIVEVRRMLGDTGKVLLSTNGRQQSFRVPVLPEKPWITDLRLIAKAVEGNYPNYQTVIPKDHPHCIVVERERLLWAVKRVSLAASDSECRVTLTVSPGFVSVEASSVNGRAREVMPAKFDGPEFSVAFNHAYLTPPLEATESPEIEVLLKDADSCAMFRDGGFLCVVMPQRIG